MKFNRVLSASFVVTVAALPVCNKEPRINPCNPPGPGCPGFVSTSKPSPRPALSVSAVPSVGGRPSTTTEPKTAIGWLNIRPANPNWPLRQREDGSCWQTTPLRNPLANAAHRVRCLRPASRGAKVVRRANGTCWESASRRCRRRGNCNPPPPRPVLCPPSS
jgi:hypothetical protein